MKSVVAFLCFLTEIIVVFGAEQSEEPLFAGTTVHEEYTFNATDDRFVDETYSVIAKPNTAELSNSDKLIYLSAEYACSTTGLLCRVAERYCTKTTYHGTPIFFVEITEEPETEETSVLPDNESLQGVETPFTGYTNLFSNLFSNLLNEWDNIPFVPVVCMVFLNIAFFSWVLHIVKKRVHKARIDAIVNDVFTNNANFRTRRAQQHGYRELSASSLDREMLNLMVRNLEREDSSTDTGTPMGSLKVAKRARKLPSKKSPEFTFNIFRIPPDPSRNINTPESEMALKSLIVHKGSSPDEETRFDIYLLTIKTYNQYCEELRLDTIEDVEHKVSEMKLKWNTNWIRGLTISTRYLKLASKYDADTISTIMNYVHQILVLLVESSSAVDFEFAFGHNNPRKLLKYVEKGTSKDLDVCMKLCWSTFMHCIDFGARSEIYINEQEQSAMH